MRMHLFEGNKLIAQFEGGPSLASWLIGHPDTHDYEWTGSTYRLKFRSPWVLLERPAMSEGG